MQVLLSRTAQAGARRHFAGANRRCALCSMLQVVRDWFNAPWLNHCSCHICWNQADGRSLSRRGLALKLTRLSTYSKRHCVVSTRLWTSYQKNYSHVTLLKGNPASS